MADRYTLGGNGAGNGSGNGGGPDGGGGGGEDLAAAVRAMQSQVSTGFANLASGIASLQSRLDALNAHFGTLHENLRDVFGIKVRELEGRVEKLEGKGGQ